MITRRGFLIASASLAGGRVLAGLGADRLVGDRLVDDRLVGGSSKALHIVDARLAVVHSGESTASNVQAPVLRLDGDVGELWQRIVRPLIAVRASRDTRERTTYIEGLTSYADGFVLSTLCAEYGFAYGSSTHASIPPSLSLTQANAPFDPVQWRLEFAGFQAAA